MQLGSSFLANRRKTDHFRTILSILLVFLLTINYSQAQQWMSSADDRELAQYHLQLLDEGTLLYILKGDMKKRNELLRVMESDQATKSQKNHAEKQYHQSIESRNKFHLELTSALQEYYTFSDYRLIYDHDLDDFLIGRRGLFLNDSLQIDSSITLDTLSTPYLAKEEYHEGVLSYVVYTPENKEIPFPFPNVKITSSGPGLLIRSIFDKSDYRPADVIVKRFDELLFQRLQMLNDKTDKKTEEPDED